MSSFFSSSIKIAMGYNGSSTIDMFPSQFLLTSDFGRKLMMKVRMMQQPVGRSIKSCHENDPERERER
eukprot:c32359_g1_i1 orf=1-201(-)